MIANPLSLKRVPREQACRDSNAADFPAAGKSFFTTKATKKGLLQSLAMCFSFVAFVLFVVKAFFFRLE
jgi:hypothetical protein